MIKSLSTATVRGPVGHTLRRFVVIQRQQQLQIKNLSSSTTSRTAAIRSTTSTPSLLTFNFVSKSFLASNSQHRFSSNLSSLLNRELIEETETNPIEMPEELSNLKKSLSAKWTIVDGSATDSDGATIKMFKKEPTSNGSKVVLKFHCQDTVQEEGGLLDNIGGGDDDEEEEEMSPPLHFEVHVSRAGKTMKLACISEDAQAIVEGVTIVPSDDSSPSSGGDEDDLYRGPILEDLPEDVRDEFDLYVKEECGVDEDVASFAAMYADYREQAEYVRWLKEVKKIVE